MKISKSFILLILLLEVVLIYNKRPIDTNFFWEENYNDKSSDEEEFKDECLVSIEEAKTLLKEKYGMEAPEKPDKRTRFILGKCNPVIVMSGLFATRLSFTINCKKFSQEENGRKMIETRLYCGETVCKNEDKEYEEHVLLPGLFNTPFTIVEGKKNKYSACLGYFLQYHNNKNECPKQENGKEICLYSDAVRISYYGGTKETENESQCGLKPMRNIVSSGIKYVVDDLINFDSAKALDVVIRNFDKMGYESGFSLAGVPFDYRRFISTNRFALEGFKYHIKRLYENTGKPVIIIGHSLGNLMIQHSLLQMDKDLLSKVKTFVALNPPFAGASELIKIFLYGFHEFDMTIKVKGHKLLQTRFDMFGQSLLFQSIPTIAELRPLPILSKIFKDKRYESFTKAIEEYAEIQKQCAFVNCTPEFVQENSVHFKEIYGNTFPSLDDKECQLPPEETNDFVHPCRSELHMQTQCPSLFIVNTPTYANVLDSLCGVKNSSLLYNVECNDNTTTCLDSLYANNKYPFNNPKLDELINDFNAKYSKKYNITIDQTFFEDEQTSQQKILKVIDHHSNISTTQSLPIPPVNTVIIYGHHIATQTAFIYNPDPTLTQIDGILFKGGDSTVPLWSSFLVGLKWLYDKKVENLPQNITLVEYCSTLAKPGEKYAFDKNKPKDFYGIGCECLDDEYKTYKRGNCKHSTGLLDQKLMKFIREGLVTDESNLDNVTQDRIDSVKKYDKKRKYEKECNKELRVIFENDSGK